MSQAEQALKDLFTHEEVKQAISRVLQAIVERERSNRIPPRSTSVLALWPYGTVALMAATTSNGSLTKCCESLQAMTMIGSSSNTIVTRAPNGIRELPPEVAPDDR